MTACIGPPLTRRGYSSASFDLRAFASSIWTAAASLPVPYFHREDEKRQHESDSIGDDHRPCADDQSISEPERHTRRKNAVHPERNARGVFCFPGMPCLRNEGGGGERRSQGADKITEMLEVGKGHQTFFAKGSGERTGNVATKSVPAADAREYSANIVFE
jgi:hypothetical protein